MMVDFLMALFQWGMIVVVSLLMAIVVDNGVQRMTRGR